MQHHDISAKSSTRIGQPPGGASSISLRSDGQPWTPRGVRTFTAKHGTEQAEKSSTRVAQVPGGKSSIKFGAEGAVSTADQAPRSHRKAVAYTRHEPADKTSTRVSQPAGGKSSIVFGSTGEDPAPKTRAHPPITPRRNPLTHSSPGKASKPLGTTQESAFAVPEPVGVVKKLHKPKASEYIPKDSAKNMIYGGAISPGKPQGRKNVPKPIQGPAAAPASIRVNQAPGGRSSIVLA